MCPQSQCSQAVYNIQLNSYDLHETFLTAHHGKSAYWFRWICTAMGNQCTGLGGSVLDQHSTNTLGEIKEITVLCTLPIYRAPLKFTTKQKQEITEALSSPLL